MRRTPLLVVTLWMVLASNWCWAQSQWEFPLFGSALYPTRWGNVEGSQDLVPDPPVLGLPVCARMGTTLGLGLRWRGTASRLLGWMPTKVVLERAVTGELIWQHLWQGSGQWLPAEVVYLLPPLPNHVEAARLWSEGLLLIWTGFPWQPVGVYGYSTRGMPSEVFIVLDAPKAPMNPAWVSVLRYSCRWASSAQDAPAAARKVTDALHRWGAYNGGHQAFTSDSTDTSENFYLRRCIDSFSNDQTVGQCNDFANLLLCLQTSLGIGNRAVQRSHPLDPASRETHLSNGNRGRLLGFRTKNIDAAPYGASSYDGTPTWTYHQFCIDSQNALIWDACLQFYPSYRIAVTGMSQVPDYRDNLVDTYYLRDLTTLQVISESDATFFWIPTPVGGFIPNVTAN